MAWVAYEDFDSYSNGDLNGNNGGTGWSAAWSGSGDYDVQSTTVLQGTKSIQQNGSGTEPEIARSLTASTTDGTMVYLTRRNITNGGVPVMNISESGARVCGVYFDTSAQIQAYGSASNVIGSYAADTTYQIAIQYDCGTDQFRVSIDGGAYSSWYDFFTTETSLTGVLIRFNAAGPDSQNFWDYIHAPAAGPATLESWDTVTKSTIETMDTVAIANIESWNTVA